MRYLDSETIRILYRAKRNTTSLTDVKIDIWNGSGTKVVNAGTVTELSDGLYYYDYTLSSTGNFIFNITCATQAHDVEGTFQSVGRNSLWVKKSGGGGVIIPSMDPPVELIESIKELKILMNKLSKSLPKDFAKKEDLSGLDGMKKDMIFISEAIIKLLPTKDLMGFENDK